MFNWKNPTVQMLGRWQPWHDGHQELFKRCVAKTGQVVIQVRDVQGASGGDGQDDNPFDWDLVCKNIEDGLLKDGYKRGNEYEIIPPPFVGTIFSIVILPGATVSPLSFSSQLINKIRENKKIDKKFLVFINLKVTTQDSGSSLD